MDCGAWIARRDAADLLPKIVEQMSEKFVRAGIPLSKVTWSAKAGVLVYAVAEP